ncbi:MAG: putative membrane protein YfcA [Colwellia sp.]|jgi:uncharacterized membrane protein YfcA
MDWIIIVIAGFSAGLLNAIAGGGSFITLPALTFLGISPIMANATGTAALLPGYIASAWRFRGELKTLPALSFLRLFSLATIGGAAGAILLLLGNDALFIAIIPWFIIGATLLFLFRDRLTKPTIKRIPSPSSVVSSLIFFIVCVYGGYFNGGIGVILLATFGLLGLNNLKEMNGLKNIVSAILTIIAVFIYILGGLIEWVPMLIMGTSSAVGGYIGASISYKISDKWVIIVIVSTGLISFIYFI